MGSFAYALKILLIVVILVSLKLDNCFEISKFTTLRLKAAIDRFGQACQADTRGERIHITCNLVVGRVKVIRWNC